MIGGGRRNDRRDERQCHLTDACELVGDFLLLGFELLGIAQVLPFAAATYAKMLTNRCYTMLRILVISDGLGYPKLLFLLCYLQIYNIVRGTIAFYEYHHFAVPCEAFARRGYFFDIYLLQNGQHFLFLRLHSHKFMAL